MQNMLPKHLWMNVQGIQEYSFAVARESMVGVRIIVHPQNLAHDKCFALICCGLVHARCYFEAKGLIHWHYGMWGDILVQMQYHYNSIVSQIERCDI